MVKIYGVFHVFIPEAHGLTRGSNTGNYAETWIFATVQHQFAIKCRTSADGDLLPYPDWEFVPAQEWWQKYKDAEYVEQDELSRLLSVGY